MIMARGNFMDKMLIANEILSYLYPTNKASATVVIAHGMMEHPMRYQRFAQYLNEHGYNAVVFNQIGHGEKATPKLGHWEKGSFKKSVENYHKVIAFAKSHFKNDNIILFAHSMGSFIAQDYITEYPNEINGLILSGSNGPMLMTKLGALVTEVFRNNDSKPNKFLHDLMFRPYQKAFIPARSPFDWLSSDPDEVDKYLNDPLCGFVCSTGFFKEFLKGLANLNTTTKLAKISKELPILIVSGKEDPVGQNGAGIEKLANLYLKNNIKSVNLIIYPKARHELLNDFTRITVMEDVTNWIKKIR
jgi:alpha-beta hydrolase superfamily lysophospholipase